MRGRARDDVTRQPVGTHPWVEPFLGRRQPQNCVLGEDAYVASQREL